MLEIKDLNVFYGAIHALKGISLKVADGELVSLIGANGAGKTTTLHTISGLLTASSGSITLDGKNLQKVPANTIISLGLSHVPEGRHVFARMSVEENLRMGAYIARSRKIWNKSTPTSPGSKSAAASWPAPSPAASSRCWPPAGR